MAGGAGIDFGAVVSGMGVDPKDLESGELLLRARSYLEAYRKDVPANCKRAADLSEGDPGGAAGAGRNPRCR